MSSRIQSYWLADLGIVVAFALVAAAAILVPAVPELVGQAFGVALLVFVPGYAVVAAAFPERATGEDGPDAAASRTPSWPIVLGLAFATSVLLVAVLGTALAARGRLELAPVVLALVVLTVLGAVVAAVRRLWTDPQYRRAPFDSGPLGPVSTMLAGSRRQNVAFALAVVLLVAAAGVTAAFASPNEDETFTEFAVLERTDDGELVADEYPDSIVAGDGHTFNLLVENHEHQREDYTVVVVAQRVDDGTVTEQRRLDTVEISVAAGERRVVEHDVVPQAPGEDVRIQFLLYKGDVPETASAESADVALHVWTDVVTSEGNASAIPTVASPAVSSLAPDYGVQVRNSEPISTT